MVTLNSYIRIGNIGIVLAGMIGSNTGCGKQSPPLKRLCSSSPVELKSAEIAGAQRSETSLKLQCLSYPAGCYLQQKNVAFNYNVKTAESFSETAIMPEDDYRWLRVVNNGKTAIDSIVDVKDISGITTPFEKITIISMEGIRDSFPKTSHDYLNAQASIDCAKRLAEE